MFRPVKVYPLWAYRVLYDPFEAWLALSGIIAGVAIFYPGVEPVSITAALPVELQQAWGIAAFLGGVPCLVGVLTGSVRLRYTGLTLLAPSLAIVGLTNAYVNWPAGVYAGTVLTISLAIAAWLKLLEMGRAIDRAQPILHPEER